MVIMQLSWPDWIHSLSIFVPKVQSDINVHNVPVGSLYLTPIDDQGAKLYNLMINTKNKLGKMIMKIRNTLIASVVLESEQTATSRDTVE